MAIITSAIMAFKGALFLTKSAAFKGAIIKYGSYLLTTKGVVTTVSTGLTAATVAGYFATIKSIPQRSIEGYTQVVNGISNDSFVDFMDGVYKLSLVYNTANSLLSDFNEFVDAREWSAEVKISLKKSMKGMKSILENEIEQKSYALLKDIEKHLRSRGMSSEDYSNQINTIYIKHTFDLKDDYVELLGRGGRIYSDISTLNQSLLIGRVNEYDHYLAYCIAGWMKDNLQFSCIVRKTQKDIAGDITNHIFAYLHAYGLG